jgi:TRAP-type C4-dicarboxylate transport system permease small subunit
MDRVVRANGYATLWLARIATVALAIIAVVTFCDVIGRYVFNRPFIFTVELTEIAMAVVVYFGVGLVTHEDAHISADFVTLRLSPRLRALFALVTNLLALGFLALVAWRLWRHTGALYATGDTTQVWRLPVWPIAGAVAFGSLFLLTGVLLQFVGAWARLIDPRRQPTPPAPLPPYRE